MQNKSYFYCGPSLKEQEITKTESWPEKNFERKKCSSS